MQEAGFFGKHPSFGDFISHGLPADLRDEVQDWLTGCLAQSRIRLGESFNSVWDVSCPIRFWIGGGVLDFGCSIKGVMVASSDKVGRRFPFVVIAACGSEEQPPVVTPDQRVFEAWETGIMRSFGLDAEKVGNLLPLTGFSRPSQPLAPGTVWATNPVVDISDLLKAVGPVDHARAAAGRTYWWARATDVRQGAVWTCDGLPGADAMTWLLTGVASPAPQAGQGA